VGRGAGGLGIPIVGAVVEVAVLLVVVSVGAVSGFLLPPPRTRPEAA